MDNLESKLREIKIENFIWLIYIGIIILSYYSNYLEKDYFINKNNKSKEKYREILILIFSILLIVYLYFFIDSISDIKNINKYSNDKKNLVLLSSLASLLVLISGIIFLYISYKDENIDVEIAFN